jgi:hypothetical protein
MSVIRGLDDETRERTRVSSVEDLDVFRRAYAISLDLHHASLKFPRSNSLAGSLIKFGGQANRSAPTWQKGLASNDDRIWNSSAIF